MHVITEIRTAPGLRSLQPWLVIRVGAIRAELPKSSCRTLQYGKAAR